MLPSGDRLRCRSVGWTVLSDWSDSEDSSEGVSRSLPILLIGRASLMSESPGKVVSCRYEEADDLSDRKLVLPVSAMLVSEWSELPDESEGDSRDRSEVVRLGTGDFIGSLLSEDALETRPWRTLAVICGSTGFCSGEAWIGSDGIRIPGSPAGVPGVATCGFGKSSLVGRPNLIVKKNVEPFPGTLRASILPPCSSTNCIEMANPSPVPPCCLVLLASIWLKRLNRYFASRSLNPLPVSTISN